MNNIKYRENIPEKWPVPDAHICQYICQLAGGQRKLRGLARQRLR